MAKLKVAVIGVGHLGKIHAKLWKNHENAELTGVYDIDKENSLKVCQEHNCKPFDSIDELIANCDAATIAVPTSEHYSVAIELIRKGKHCLIEKPITNKYEEALLLIEEAKINNVIIQVGHVERFNPALAALKDINIEPVFIEAHRLSQFKPRAIDVSVIHDLMIHDIDIVKWLIKSQVKSIDSNGVGVLTDTADIANCRIRFENGSVVNLTASRISASPMRKMRIFQKNAYISIDFGKPEVEIFRLAEKIDGESGIPATMLGSIDEGLKNKSIFYSKPAIPKLNAIEEEQAAFIKSILNGNPIPVGAEDAAEALKIAEMIESQINSQ